jgi:RNA polymerase sigma-70 factor (ECF subfamily)
MFAPMTTTTAEARWAFGSEVERYVRRRIPASDAEDVVQDVWLRFHERLGALRDDERIAPWLFRIARSVVVDHLRRRRPGAELPDVPDEREADDNHNETVASWLPAMLESLPEPYRQALRLVEIDGVAQSELATRLGLSPSGAKSRVQRARRMLVDALRDCCHVELDRRGNVVDWRSRGECEGC